MEITREYDVQKLEEFYNLLLKEWGKVDPFEQVSNGVRLPRPILAIENKELIGGVAFTWYVHPEGMGDALWINSIYVLPDKRGCGVATALLKEAMESVDVSDELFVLSNIPELYIKQGWHVISTEGENSVLKFEK